MCEWQVNLCDPIVIAMYASAIIAIMSNITALTALLTTITVDYGRLHGKVTTVNPAQPHS